MKSIWNGVLRFGAIPVPVALVPAKRDGSASFRTLHRECGSPVQETTVCPLHGDVAADELVKGWEVAPGQFVLVEDAELDALAPDPGRDLEALAYVAAGAIDATLVRSSYFLRPAAELAGKRAYALLAAALHETAAAIVTRHVARKKEHLSAVTAVDARLLVLHTLALHEELVDPEPIRQTLEGVDPEAVESELARKLIERYTSAFNPSILVSSQRAAVRELLERKLTHDELVVPDTRPAQMPQTNITAAGSSDFTAALRASLRDAPRRKRAAART